MRPKEMNTKLDSLISDLHLLTQKCNRDIQIKNLTRARSYMDKYNRLLEETKTLDADIYVKFKPISRNILGILVDTGDELLGIMSKVDYSATELLQELESTRIARSREISLPLDLFDKMKFHPKVIKASRSLFMNEHYSDAVFRAFTTVCSYVKEKSGSPIDSKGSPLDGKSLMSTAFSEKKPIIQLNDLSNPSDRDEQEGFKFLFMGGQVGIRNPKAHDNIVQNDPYRTLEYLSLASILIKRVQEGQVAE